MMRLFPGCLLCFALFLLFSLRVYLFLLFSATDVDVVGFESFFTLFFFFFFFFFFLNDCDTIR